MGASYISKYYLTSDDAIILNDVAIDDARAREEPVTEVLLIEARRQVEFVQILKKDKTGELDIECLAKIQSQQTLEDEIQQTQVHERNGHKRDPISALVAKKENMYNKPC